ncbi:hypothetical protein [Staphylococcus hyicus]|uniref:Uncharacterized protein n=1 Tax=Staphylococcus hyicus TaxID=1284 RepID=A0ACD5FKJ7_STAHY|nr:hypothetical protein [Staphylococcus hyicus]MDP4447477.1 hypothetical protein [Staphylococcus hyicus]MDP4464448.1 hypothetical protein [Staphylococcus hyicus]UWF56060.1 hypothetical protein NZD48_08335 [Staphylococcus hyicus]
MEKPYMLTYDLNSPGQKYEELRNVIKKEISNGYCNYWESSFVFRSSLTPSEMLDKMQPYLDQGDKLFVTEIINNKQGWLTKEQWNFINQNIF